MRTQHPRRPGRLGHRQPRPVPRGDRHLADRRGRPDRVLHGDRHEVEELMRRRGRLLAALFVLVIGRLMRRRDRDRAPEDRIVPPASESRGAEAIVIALFFAGALCAAAFMVIYGFDRLGNQTPAARDRARPVARIPGGGVDHDGEAAARDGGEGGGLPGARASGGAGGDRAARRGERDAASRASGCSPSRAGPRAAHCSWPRSRRRCRSARGRTRTRSTERRGAGAAGSSTATGRPWKADDIEADLLHGVPRRRKPPTRSALRWSSCAVDPSALRLPPERAGWAPEGIVAYSKICTHAGCAVALYREPMFPPTQPRPALVCPCHYSTFDPAERRQRDLRPGRTAAAAAAARDRRERRAARRRATLSGPSGPSGGASAARVQARDPARGQVPGRAHGRCAVHAQGAALRLPGPLVVPARRGRALRVHRAGRDRRLPDALLRAEPRQTTYHGVYAPLQGVADERGLPVGGRPLVRASRRGC